MRRQTTIVLTLLVAAAVTAGLIVRARATRWEPVLSIRLPNGDAVTYGWQVGNAYPLHYRLLGFHHPDYMEVLVWNRADGSTMQYMVFGGHDMPIPEVEIRATPDLRGIWLLGESGPDRRVIASLDLTTGEFLSLNGIPLDGTRPLGWQLRREGMLVGEQRPYPSWATGSGGMLLAREPASATARP